MNEPLHFTDFDYIIIGVMVFSCVFAYFRGLVREILSLIAWIGAGVVTICYFPAATVNLQQHFKSPVVAATIAGVGIYLLALIGFGLLNMIVVKSLKSSGESGVLDNMLGLLFGAARGALMVSLAFFLITVALPEKEYPEWLKQSVTRPYVAQGAAVLARVAPQYLFEIASLEKHTEDELQGKPDLKPTAAAPSNQNYNATNNNTGNSGVVDNSSAGDTTGGYNRTTTQQLDRLIDSTGNQ